MKILIVEDDTASRILLGKILRKEGYDTVLVGDGIAAIEMMQKDKFDAVITDWMMPNLDGLELIEFIRKEIKPVPVILVVTALASKEAKEKVFNAGADDYFAKPYSSKEVLDRLSLNLMRRDSDLLRDHAIIESVKSNLPDFVGVGIAASTGGPQTLIKIFSGLKYTKKASFFVVLHGPSWMLESFTERIQNETDLVVKLGREGLKIEHGTVYIAPGDYHMIINNTRNTLQLIDSPPENFVKPSADPMFKSIASTFGKNCVGVVLTGMGKDGSIGAGYISAAGGIVIAQDPATATLPSMPKSVIDLRLAKYIIPLEHVASTIRKNVDIVYSTIGK